MVKCRQFEICDGAHIPSRSSKGVFKRAKLPQPHHRDAGIFHNLRSVTFDCRSPIGTSPASPIEMSRSSVCLRLVEVAWDDGDHDEPQGVDAPAGAN